MPANLPRRRCGILTISRTDEAPARTPALPGRRWRTLAATALWPAAAVVAAFALLLAPAGAGAQPSTPKPRPIDAVSVYPERSPLHPGESFNLIVTVEIAKGWHINSVTPLEEFLIPTAIVLEPAENISFGVPFNPPHHLRKFPFSDQKMAVYESTVAFRVPVQISPDAPLGTLGFRGSVAYQACDDKQCLPPASESFAAVIPVEAAGTASRPVVGPAGTPAADDASSERGAVPAAPPERGLKAWLTRVLGGFDLENKFAEHGWGFTLILIFVMGLGLNFTPCIYPIIPITLGYFSMQTGGKPGKTFGLASLYALGLTLVNSLLGAAAGAFGGVVGGILRYPAVLVVLAAVMVALGLSLFGLWEIRMPQFLMRHGEAKGGYAGAFAMGLVSGIVAAPCIGPFVVGLLSFIAARQDPMLGFWLFFVMSIGLGLPFMLLSTSTALLARLPRAGAWMVAVRQFFGVVLFFMAAYFLKPLLNDRVYLAISFAILVAGAIYLFAGLRRTPPASWPRRLQIALALAIALAAGLRAVELGTNIGILGERAADQFAPYSEANISAARGKTPVMIDFTADWCLPCKQLEDRVFPAAAVRQAAEGVTLLRADLTRSDPVLDALLAKYQVVGFPTLVFLGLDGKERADLRHFGLLDAPQLAAKLDALRAAKP